MANWSTGPMKIEKKKLSLAKFEKLRDLIYERSGIFFPEGKLYLLEGRLNKRLRELSFYSFDEYVSYLNYIPNQNTELSKIYNLVTINETYFFRYEKQLDVFSKKLLPELIKKKTEKGLNRLKIWSSASSSGEEAYTIAILLKEILKVKTDKFNIDLTGTDISQKILSQARLAIYGNNSFRGHVNNYLKNKYFEKENDKFKIIDDIKKMVKFAYLNLNDINGIRKLRGVDFLFCRNVLIYFDLKMKKRVVRAFYDVLNHGGYLFLGEAESLHGISSAFKVIHFPGAFVYFKE